MMIDALARYVTFTVSTGDYKNDWVTHLPGVVRPIVMLFGHLLALMIGA